MPGRLHAAALAVPSAPAAPHLRTFRLRLEDGAATTVHVAAHDAAAWALRVVRLRSPQPLAAWCARTGEEEALVGGFYVRPGGEPLGELRTRGVARRHVPFLAPWAAERACVHVAGGRVRILPRSALPAAPAGDLLQAGPLLVAAGRPVVREDEDPEGFSAGSEQFDSDITAGRHPRAALALAGGRLLAVACDGRDRRDAGLTLAELAGLLARLGADHALNLDGGGSTSLVCAGVLRNRPREAPGVELPGGRSVTTALVFAPGVHAPFARL